MSSFEPKNEKNLEKVRKLISTYGCWFAVDKEYTAIRDDTKHSNANHKNTGNEFITYVYEFGIYKTFSRNFNFYLLNGYKVSSSVIVDSNIR